MLRNVAQELYDLETNDPSFADEAQTFPVSAMNNFDLLNEAQGLVEHAPNVFRKTRNSTQQWEYLKEDIREAYICKDNTLATTMQLMEAKHGFRAR
jgi:Clr5 domain